MKFSWISLNYFLNLDKIKINKLIDILAIKGFEIDKIDYNQKIQDYILDIAVTANRQDTLSTFGLANELSYIFNKKIINQYKVQQYKIDYDNLFKESESKYLYKIRANKIIKIKKHISPLWLINYLKMHDIESKNLIFDIKQYIKIKWGHDIHFFDITKMDNIYEQTLNKNITINQYLSNEKIQYKNNILIHINGSNTKINHKLTYNNISKSILVFSYIYNDDYKHNIKNIYNTIDDMQGYEEALQLLATFGNACISKSYSYHSTIKRKKYIINIQKNLIQHTLGPIKNTTSKYLKTETIHRILKQLNFKPKYNYYNKNFTITIPTYRINDLYRTIDIIEEIGRIYGYHNFIDRLPKFKNQGYSSKTYQIVKEVRKYFRDLGIHEVINSSLDNSSQNNLNNIIKSNIFAKISIYNPLLEDQSYLRNNLIDNLIKNKIYNYKQKNNNTEFFEIGKIFKKHISTNQTIEEIHLGGILANTQFIKESWDTKHSQLNWFHAKGIIEQFFEKMQLDTAYYKIHDLNNKKIKDFSLKNFDVNRTVYIVNTINNQIIGLIGQINRDLYKNIGNNEIINIFELNLNHTTCNYDKKSHLSYIFSKYSIYPSVTRDISIRINKNDSINEIQKFIYNLNKKLIQKVEVFNQYKDITNINKKCVGIRITYNGKSKTLDQADLRIIEQNITTILKNYQNS